MIIGGILKYSEKHSKDVINIEGSNIVEIIKQFNKLKLNLKDVENELGFRPQRITINGSRREGGSVSFYAHENGRNKALHFRIIRERFN